MGLEDKLEKIKNLGLSEIKEELMSSPALKFTIKEVGISNERSALIASSVFTALMKVAWLDRELTELEAQYLLRESSAWCDFEEENRKFMLDAHSTLVRRNIKFKKYIPYHLAYLGIVLDEMDRVLLLETLVVISRSDLEVSKIEEKFLSELGEYLRVPSAKTTELIMNAKFLVQQRLDSVRDLKIVEKEKEQSTYELPDISFDW